MDGDKGLSEKVTFKCRIVRSTYDTETFKCYAVDVDKQKYPFVKFTKYGNAAICGDIQTLADGQEYEVTGIETNTKHGYSYKITNIKRDKPHTEAEMQSFLEEILTSKQASELFREYPNIVDKIIQNDYADIDLSKVSGVKEKTFAKIVEKVKSNYSLIELVGMFKGVLSISILKKLYSKYASAKVVENKLREDGYKCLCGISRVGFKMADGLLQELEREKIIKFDYDLKTSPQRCLSCVLYFLEENESNGNTKMSIKKLKNECDTLVPECSVHFVGVIKNNRIFYDRVTLMVGLKSTYDTEKYIADHIIEGLKSNIIWDYDIEKYRNFDGGSLTDEQINALQNVCKYNISILNGQGGTGKSQTSNAIIKMLQDNHKSFMLFAPTGRAAKVLSGYTKQKASTIHRGLGFKPPDKWVYNEDCKLFCDVLIIDEFSMTDIFIAKKIFEALDLTKTKLLIIGDNAQLPSVSCGNILHDFMMSDIIPTTTLTRVFRYGEDGLMTVATDVRNCKQYFKQDTNSKIEFYGKNKDYAFINSTPANIIKNTLGLYKKLLSQGNIPSDIQVLTAYNKGEYGTIVLNNHLQKIANKNYGKTDYIKVGEVTYYVGDIVIQKKNNYEAELANYNRNIDFDVPMENPVTFIANGEIGIITEINGYYLTIDFNDNKVIYHRDNMVDVGLGYCISVHKSQGGNSKIIILLTPLAHTYMLNSNLVYVGLTRMREKCFHLGDKATVNRAIKKKENFDRNTFMQELLKGELK